MLKQGGHIMGTDKIITIGRQYGSMGRQIGKKLADDLGIPYYDKEILKEAAKKSGICEELFESFDEKPTNSFLYSLVMDPYSIGFHNSFDMPLNHKVFLASFDAIKDIANKGPCVIVGRCADYALSEYSNLLSVFIYAQLEQRIKTVMERNDIPKDKAKDLITKTDKQRASYYNYYTSKKWGDSASYDLTLDSGKLGIDGCVAMILKFREIMDAQKK